MRKRMMLCALALVGTALPVRAQDAGKVSVSGTSTVRGWTCSAAPAVTIDGSLADVVAGTKAVGKAALTIDVAKLDCGNGKMNDHMRKALKADAHGVIRWDLMSYEIRTAAEGAAVAATGTLMIAGSAQPVTLDLTLTQGASGQVRARGEYKFAMTQYGVKPPSLMMGTMKVGDAVTVKFDVPLTGVPVRTAGATSGQ